MKEYGGSAGAGKGRGKQPSLNIIYNIIASNERNNFKNLGSVLTISDFH
jgi:hypothetical protein